MYTYQEPYSIKEMKNNATLTTTADTVSVGCRKFVIANTGAQPLYFKEKSYDNVDCTTSNSMLVPAGTVFPQVLTARTLSLISNSTGTSYVIMYLDI